MWKLFKRLRFAAIIVVFALGLIIFYYMVTDKKHPHNFDGTVTQKDSSGRYGNGQCYPLYIIARKMLNGLTIELPFESEQTKWKFHDEKDLDWLSKTSLKWNHKGENLREIRTVVNFYRNAKSRDINGKKYFITFANNCCNVSKVKAVMCALYPGGFDATKIHDFNSLNSGFKLQHGNILNQPKGSGYWLWKPYIMLKTLVEDLQDGDFLMYQDAGAYIIKDAGPLLKLCRDSKYGILLFYLTLLEKVYTKRDAFVLMNMDDNRVYKTLQRSASFLFLQRNCMSLQFVMEWLAYASNPRIITDMDNTMGKENIKGFKEHRHDQSVLSLLSKKWGLYAFRIPSQFGNPIGYRGGPYDQIISHSRYRG